MRQATFWLTLLCTACAQQPGLVEDPAASEECRRLAREYQRINQAPDPYQGPGGVRDTQQKEQTEPIKEKAKRLQELEAQYNMQCR